MAAIALPLAAQNLLASISLIGTSSATSAYLQDKDEVLRDPSTGINTGRSIVHKNQQGSDPSPNYTYGDLNLSTGAYTTLNGNVDFVISEPGVTTASIFGGGLAYYNTGYVVASTEGSGGGSRNISGDGGPSGLGNTFATNTVNFVVGSGPAQPYNFGTNYEVGIGTGNGIAAVQFTLNPTDSSGNPIGSPVFDIVKIVGQAGTSDTVDSIIQSGMLSPGQYSLVVSAYINDPTLQANSSIIARWDTLEFFVAVPEPSRALLLLGGLCMTILRRRRLAA